jgi:bifunctional non-homologous end joining protein LigD
MLQRTLPAGFIAPCLPTKTTQLPSGGQWLHEIKHDGFRIIARKSDGRVRLYSRPGNDFTRRFPLIVEALERLRSRSCIIDGEAVACDDNGVFDLVRHHRANDSVFLYAFDLIELNGDDLRRDPLELRKATLASVLAKAGPGIRFNEHIEGDGPTVFRPCLQAGARRHCLEAKGLGLPLRPLARLAQNEELGCPGSEARRRGRLGQKEMAIMGKNWVMIYGPKTERILAGVLTVASGGWLILILLGYLGSLGWGYVLGLFVLFGIGVASLLTGPR